MKQNDIKKLVKRVVPFLLLPLLILFVVEVLVLPVDYFAFRPWEALRQSSMKILPGGFYPEVKLQRLEQGDLAPYTPYAINRETYWETDKSGFRNRQTDKEPEIMLVGDSNFTGCKLDQDETIKEVLQQQIGQTTYSYAPTDGGLLRYMHDKHFQKKQPKVIVLESIERAIGSLKPLGYHKQKEERRASASQFLLKNPTLAHVGVAIDRLLKWPMYHYFRGKIERNSQEPAFTRKGSYVFLQGEEAFAEKSEEDITQVVQVLEEYKEALEKKGIRFIFLPIPNKENIMHEMFPGQQKPPYLSQLIAALQEKGIEVIDLQTAFDKAYQQGTQLYLKDDSHWNPNGVKIAASLLAQALEKPAYTAAVVPKN
ncbi:hypothetical protein ACFSKU_06365 [Pontibacter silvestris]|uniref:AlgX/AlgJ SGNH hydrolase-like domain-containing protein n=1 Tax=Pontibacter silvestris TaxID=2305183 RepID=A0ABW4WUS8_9BACT|nr:hypothetical protein [Pontibacter silvestris]MCC9136458.1 hypothetical protein [Pontibacter silvestris]